MFNILLECLSDIYIAGEMLCLVQGGENHFINWEKYGLRMMLSKESILFKDVAEITVVALVGGKFILPENTVLVSAVYEISLSEPLHKPLRLEMQHCIDLKSEPNLSKHLKFAIAPTETPSHSYQFTMVEGGEFPVDSQYGLIERNEFCLVCILGEDNGKNGSTNGSEGEQQQGGNEQQSEGGETNQQQQHTGTEGGEQENDRQKTEGQGGGGEQQSGERNGQQQSGGSGGGGGNEHHMHQQSGGAEIAEQQQSTGDGNDIQQRFEGEGESNTPLKTRRNQEEHSNDTENKGYAAHQATGLSFPLTCTEPCICADYECKLYL